MITLEKSVGAVVFRKEKNKIKYLLLHYQSGHWDFPKGHVEKGETDEDTLRREVREETGIGNLKINPEFIGKSEYRYEARGNELKKRTKEGRGTKIKKQVIYYLAETGKESVRVSFEHKGFKWLDFDGALRRITYKNSRNVLEKAHKFLNKA